jgi:hypothetical protein
MPRPPLGVPPKGFGQHAATVQRISRQVAEQTDRPAEWRSKVCKALNEAAALLNADMERDIADPPCKACKARKAKAA